MEELQPSDRPVRRRPSKLVLTITLTPIVILIAGGYVSGAIFPTLIKSHPVWLVLLDPRARNLVLVATRLSVTTYFTVAIIRRIFSHPLFFLIGRWYGDAGVRWLEKRSPDIGALATTLERWFPRYGWLLCGLYPHPLVCTMAGGSPMGFAAFIFYNFVGTLLIVAISRQFGWMVKAPVSGLTHWISHYSLPLTILSFALVGYYIWDGRRRGTSKLESIGEMERDLESEADGPETSQAGTDVSEARQTDDHPDGTH